MKYILLMHNIIPWQKPVRIPQEMSHGKSKTSNGTTSSTMERITNWILLNLLALSEYLVKTTVVSLALLIVYSTRFLTTLLKIFERITTLSMNTKSKALARWRLKSVIKLIRFQGSRINMLRSLRDKLQTKQKQK